MAVTALSRVRITWTGLVGGPGVTTLYVTGGQTPNLAAIRAGFANVATFIPSGCVLTIANQGDIIKDDDGAITGTWSTTAVATIPCTGPGAWVPTSGGLVKFQTQTIAKNRHLQGRLFVVPLTVGSYGSDGRLLAGTVTALQGIGNGLLTATAAPFAVWSRPKMSPAVDGVRTLLEAGTSGVITASTASNFVAVLRSRRD